MNYTTQTLTIISARTTCLLTGTRVSKRVTDKEEIIRRQCLLFTDARCCFRRSLWGDWRYSALSRADRRYRSGACVNAVAICCWCFAISVPVHIGVTGIHHALPSRSNIVLRRFIVRMGCAAYTLARGTTATLMRSACRRMGSLRGSRGRGWERCRTMHSEG
jgi:hypothetical protein